MPQSPGAGWEEMWWFAAMIYAPIGRWRDPWSWPWAPVNAQTRMRMQARTHCRTISRPRALLVGIRSTKRSGAKPGEYDELLHA
jgi:hypothetical protein